MIDPKVLQERRLNLELARFNTNHQEIAGCYDQWLERIKSLWYDHFVKQSHVFSDQIPNTLTPRQQTYLKLIQDSLLTGISNETKHYQPAVYLVNTDNNSDIYHTPVLITERIINIKNPDPVNRWQNIGRTRTEDDLLVHLLYSWDLQHQVPIEMTFVCDPHSHRYGPEPQTIFSFCFDVTNSSTSNTFPVVDPGFTQTHQNWQAGVLEVSEVSEELGVMRNVKYLTLGQKVLNPRDLEKARTCNIWYTHTGLEKVTPLIEF